LVAGYPVHLVGIGKSTHMSSLNNWINSNSSPVCADGDGSPTWVDWQANQRDLFILDHEGNVVFHENISGGLPSNLNSMVMDLVNQVSDCDPTLMCGEALTCCDGMLYPTTCCSENCDEPIDVCEDACTDGEVNNDNPCNPMECWDGEWVELIIDCAEQMGVPCEGGLYLPPPDDVCCSTCVQYGDSNGDGTLNILDVVNLVGLVLNGSNDEISDINQDGMLNILDVVQLVSVILN
tara:strand:- start:2118 stop:2825 length:708 start_codon:yes stop_codon:yes gene_type:complete